MKPFARLGGIAIVAATLAVPVAAFAQSSPSPNNTWAPGISAGVPSPTDMGIGSESGQRWGIPQRPAGTGFNGGYTYAPAYGARGAYGPGGYAYAPAYGDESYAAVPNGGYVQGGPVMTPLDADDY